jgi:hypothetical protein
VYWDRFDDLYVCHFFRGLCVLAHGSGTVIGSRYFLEGKGYIIKEIDFATYKDLRLAEYSIMTSAPVVFSVIITLYYGFMNRIKTTKLLNTYII